MEELLCQSFELRAATADSELVPAGLRERAVHHQLSVGAVHGAPQVREPGAGAVLDVRLQSAQEFRLDLAHEN